MVLIGDRFETDILQANRMKIDSVFVATGVNTMEDLEEIDDRSLKAEMTPTYHRKSISNLLD